MSTDEKIPLDPPLIRACKSGDKIELNQVATYISKNGISKDDLNFVDKNGRTALSYICITNHSGVVDFLLRFEGIDVNKPDHDGNTPLHFAAEFGQSDIIAMMIKHNRNLAIDAKNSRGLTPLMKAAIQGRTDCAKRLLQANADPSLKDPGRGFTARDWDRFCGRKFCADALGELMKKRRAAHLTETPRSDVMTQEKIALPSLIPTKVIKQENASLPSPMPSTSEVKQENISLPRIMPLKVEAETSTSLSSKLRGIFHRPKSPKLHSENVLLHGNKMESA